LKQVEIDLFETRIPSFAKFLAVVLRTAFVTRFSEHDSAKYLFENISISDANLILVSQLHSQGINLRFLGYVFRQLDGNSKVGLEPDICYYWKVCDSVVILKLIIF